jgi:DtxR family Mn-dependent transcriptional regulator
LSSESVEEYLEAIHSFNEKNQLAKNQDLAEKLQVSPPSVTQMVKRLADEGLVHYEPYKGTHLTGKGMALAQKVVRKHRLLERFLFDILRIPKHKIHDEACKMEHSLSDETAAALCKALNNPETCPDDGKELPPCSLEVDDCDECAGFSEEHGQESLITQLSHLKPGEEGKVKFIRGGRRSCQRIMDMGLTPDTQIRVTAAAPFSGPIEVEVRDTSLALGRRLASHVFIEIEDREQTWIRAHPHGPHHHKQRISTRNRLNR